MPDAPVVGSAAFELRATRQKLGEDIKAAERDLKAAMGQVEQDAEKSSKSIGSSIGRMASGAMLAVTSLVTVLGLAATGALNLGLQGMKMADEIANTARRIGVGTAALQEWRFVAQKTGGDARDADKALDSFAIKLSQATAGTSKSAVKAFDFLNIGPDQLRGFKSTEQALDVVTDAIKDLKSEADRAAVAEALGLGGLSVALRDSAVDVAALRDEARQLGIVMDQEMIKRASDAQGQIDTLAQVIDINLKGAFIDLAPAIIAAIELIANLAEGLANALDQWRDLETMTGRGIKRRDQAQADEQKAMIDRYGSPGAMRGQIVKARPVEGANYTPLSGIQNARVLARGAPTLPSAEADASLGFFGNLGRNSSNVVNVPQYVDAYDHFRALNESRMRNGAELIERGAVATPARTDRSGGSTLNIPTKPAKVDRSAEREMRRSERVEQEIFRLRQRALGIADDELLTVQERYDLAQAQVKLEREAEAKELESRLARKDITQAEFTQLKLIQTQTATLEDRVSSDILARDLADERLAKERALTDLTADLLSLQSSAARTAKERREIELRLLAMAQSRAREDLERELGRTPGLSDADKQARRDALGQVQAAQAAAVNRQNMSPLEAWRDQSLKTADEIAEAYETIAARGLDALNDGIVDAIMNSRDLGETFSQVAKQIMADLLSISVRRGITEPLANALFGGAGGGGSQAFTSAGASGGGWFKKALGWGRSLLGFADGRVGHDGKIHGPGTPRSDSILALLGDDPIRVSRDESIMNAEATRRYAPFLQAMNDGVFERYLGNLRGFKNGLVGMSLPSPSVAGMGGASTAPQRILVEVGVNDDRFNAYVDGRAAPVAAQASEAAYSGARQTVPSDLARTNRYTRGARK
jgi:hypothetical protein